MIRPKAGGWAKVKRQKSWNASKIDAFNKAELPSALQGLRHVSHL